MHLVTSNKQNFPSDFRVSVPFSQWTECKYTYKNIKRRLLKTIPFQNMLRHSFQFLGQAHFCASSSWKGLVRPKAKFLCLMGDIGDPFSDVYRRFLRDVSTDFDRTFVIAGMCELGRALSCRESLLNVERQLYDVCGSVKNCHYLQENFVPVGDHAIISGCTTRLSGAPQLHRLETDLYERHTDYMHRFHGFVPDSTRVLHLTYGKPFSPHVFLKDQDILVSGQGEMTLIDAREQVEIDEDELVVL